MSCTPLNSSQDVLWQKMETGAGERARPLLALTALAEDQSLILSSQIGGSQQPVTLSPR